MFVHMYIYIHMHIRNVFVSSKGSLSKSGILSWFVSLWRLRIAMHGVYLWTFKSWNCHNLGCCTGLLGQIRYHTCYRCCLRLYGPPWCQVKRLVLVSIAQMGGRQGLFCTHKVPCFLQQGESLHAVFTGSPGINCILDFMQRPRVSPPDQSAEVQLILRFD